LPRPTATTEDLLRLFPQMPQPLSPPPLDLTPLKNLKATVETPIPVAPVKLEGQAIVDVRVTVDGPGRIAGMKTSSTGDIKAEGTALVGTPGNPASPGRFGAY